MSEFVLSGPYLLHLFGSWFGGEVCFAGGWTSVGFVYDDGGGALLYRMQHALGIHSTLVASDGVMQLCWQAGQPFVASVVGVLVAARLALSCFSHSHVTLC